MPDSLTPPKTGERIKASFLSALSSESQFTRSHRREIGSIPAGGQLSNSIILVRNQSGADIDRFGVLAISGIVFTPTDNLDGFKNGPILDCVSPLEDQDEGKFVVTCAPIPNGGIGLAFVAGVTQVKLNVNDGDDRFADIATDNTTSLTTSAGNGSARIIWKEAGIGTKWGIIQFGNMPMGKTDSPTEIDGSGSDAREETWDRATDSTPVIITRYRYTCDEDGLQEFTWTETYDSCGMLISVSEET